MLVWKLNARQSQEPCIYPAIRLASAQIYPATKTATSNADEHRRPCAERQNKKPTSKDPRSHIS